MPDDFNAALYEQLRAQFAVAGESPCTLCFMNFTDDLKVESACACITKLDTHLQVRSRIHFCQKKAHPLKRSHQCLFCFERSEVI